MSKIGHGKHFRYIAAHSIACSMQSHLSGASRIGSLSDDDARRYLQDAQGKLARLRSAQSGKDHVRAQPTPDVKERSWDEIATARALYMASKCLAKDETGDKALDTINEGEAMAFSELLKSKFPDLVGGIDEEWQYHESKCVNLFDF